MEKIRKINFTESELLMDVKLGSRCAFEQLYNLHRSVIYNNLKKLIRDEFTAKEILQDVFMRIWERRTELEPEKSFRAYLFRIARNMVMDYYRKVKTEKKLIDNLQVFASEMSDQSMESMISRDEEDLLMGAIDTLSPQRKRIFILCKLEGKSYEEVSRMLGVSSSTISDHIVKATKSIRDRLICQARTSCIIFVPFLFDNVHDVLRKII